MKFKALVKEVMKPDVITIDIEDSIKNAARLMKKNRIGSLVVIGSKKIKGILTAEDIVYKHISEGTGTKVNEIMSHKLVVIDPEKSIEEASMIMVENHVKKLPVMEGDKIVGIITASDIIKIEPVLYDTLLERLRIGNKSLKSAPRGGPIEECESCGNAGDDIHQVNGEWVCSECEEAGTL
ncbi:MAG: CBS domain-containing protein [Candidatus Aenigmarchaeota archaeon]|nr:CBS domain-containing protein [Candidatus Aenigmarchaeota archaeon]